MVSLSDIPCVGKVVDRISDAAVGAMFRGLHYMFFYKTLLNDLNSEIDKLESEKERICTKVKEESDNGKIIYSNVLTWQKEAAEIQKSAIELSPSWRCIQCLPIPNPVSRFRLGREAAHKTKMVSELTGSGRKLLEKEIAHLPPFENIQKFDIEFENFQSRKDAYGKLWRELSEGSSQILGIYGMPGVGKTRMMEQITEEAKKKKVFDLVTRANVGCTELDLISIQKQIADDLNCKLVSEDSVKSRASQLMERLKKTDKILVILDDVWEEIPLHTIGIPDATGSGPMGCKILLTSREQYVCSRNNCKHPVKITPLTDEEAWNLFSNIVGTSQLDSLADESLAKEVCGKCAGLPLLIHAVGKSLQFMPHNSWIDALGQLEEGKVENIAGIKPEVYACVKLSFDRLHDDAKWCLLLCSLFPEDAEIGIRTLIQFVTGSQLVPHAESRVRSMVDTLRSSSLLLDCEDDHIIKLHDLIRDVARSIAVRDPKYAFSFVKCGLRLPENADYEYGTRKLLHLQLERNDFYFPDDLLCQNLHNLWLHANKNIQQFSGGFYTMFENLRFLLMQEVRFSSIELHFSLQPLSKLSTLILASCDIRKTDVNFFPRNLETLCIWDCLLPVLLDLPRLQYLQKLEIKEKRGEISLVPNTISSLPSLEELHIPYGFNTRKKSVLQPILAEIGRLTHLKSLHLFFSDFESFNDSKIFGNLLEYNICVKQNGDSSDVKGSSFNYNRSINLYGNQSEVIESLIGVAQKVDLHASDIKVSSIYKGNRETFLDLRDLYIEKCNSMEYLARISTDEILPSGQRQTSFTKLTALVIENCSALKYLFCNTVAKCLVQLQKLNIDNCPEMEAIIMNECTSDGDIIKFSKLKSLKLLRLPRLTCFYGKKKKMHSSSTSSAMDNSTTPFHGMLACPSLEEVELSEMRDISEIWGKLHCSELKSLRVHNCSTLETVFPPSSMARNLMHLKTMEVSDCKMMRYIIGAQEETANDAVMVFPELKVLKLVYLPNLAGFWFNPSPEANTYKVEFPYLVNFELRCAEMNLEGIELGKNDSTCKLTSLNISFDNEIQLPSSWKLQLHNLEELRLDHCWWHEPKNLSFPSIKLLKVHRSSCRALFSPFGRLEQLQHLEISNCGLLEDIVDDERVVEVSGLDKKTFTFFQLEKVVLRNLPNFKCFTHSANFEYHMPALKSMEVINTGLSSLFTSATLRSLRQLESLQVLDCRFLEGIVEDVKGDETLDTDDEIITLSNLSNVIFRNMLKLRSFSWSASYSLSMPKLKNVYLFASPQVEMFTSSKISTGRMSYLYTEWCCAERAEDINKCIRRHYKRTRSFYANNKP